MRRSKLVLLTMVLAVLGMLQASMPVAVAQTAGPETGPGGTPKGIRRYPYMEGQHPAPAPAPVVEERPAPPPPPAPRPAGMVHKSLGFPGAYYAEGMGRHDGHVVLEKIVPSEVQVGAPFDYILRVSNRSNATIRDVTVTDEIDNNFKMESSTPQATNVADGVATWNLGVMQPGETKEIKVRGVATAPGKIEFCGTLTYIPYLCVATNVVAPKVELVKTLPAEVLICDPILMTLKVTNTGSGVARNIRITDELPDGLVTTGGEKTVNIAVGDLQGGQTVERTVNLKATKTGSFRNTAVAQGEGNLRSESTASVTVRQPVLKIAKDGPRMRYAGRPIKYNITVTNTGNAPATGLVIEDDVPAGTRFVSADEGGTLSGNRVVWNLANLEPNQSRTVSVTLTGTGIGTVKQTAVARARCAEQVAASAETDIRGIPAILLEVIDLDDPIEIGSEVTYQIVVTNQGSSTGTNIKIDVTLEDSMQYVKAVGPTAATQQGQQISFAPLPSLAPKAKATWTVTVKALQAGDERFRVRMNSDQIDRPVEESESTHFYGEAPRAAE